ncbi:MAG TPA: hypothetical protein P5527_13205 [Kiritimatiellia bacterium]|nr:hypothetical protein [Kiritimatiellia bacterium]
MSVKIELVFASVQEAANALAKLGAPTTAAPTPAAPEKAATPKADPKKETGGSPASSSAAPAASPASAEPKADAAEKATPKADAPTYEKSGLPEKIKAAVGKDKAGVVALLKEFGVSKGPELKPDQFAAFGEKIDALLAGGDLA